MTNYLLNQILEAAGQAAAEPDEIGFIGEDPVFPIPLRVGEMGAATIAAAALQAARLWTLRGGRPQQVQVAVDAAAAAMRSSRYLKVEPIPGQAEPDVRWNSRGGGGRRMYQAKDNRWIYFQREFEHHRRQICEVLQCADDEASLAEAVARWSAIELEEAVTEAGACAGAVRSAAEWEAHPQAKAIAALPLFEILRIGDGPTRPLPAGERPLSGVRVLDLTRVLAGPTGARTLAEHGADVLRISTRDMPEDEAQAIDTSHGKRGLDINLATDAGLEQLKTLIGGSDVFSQAYRPGALMAMGLGHEDVARARPGIIYCSLSAFSHEGPWQAKRGFDSVVQAACGISDEIARDGEPRSLPMNPLDYATGYLAAFAIEVALQRRATEGGSYLVRVSLAQTAHWLTSLSRVDPGSAPGAELEPTRLGSLLATTASPFGLLTHLAPIAQLSETPGRWDLPPSLLSAGPFEWP